MDCLKLNRALNMDRITGLQDLQDRFLGAWLGSVWTGLQDSKIVVMCILEIMYILFKIINNELAKRKK